MEAVVQHPSIGGSVPGQNALPGPGIPLDHGQRFAETDGGDGILPAQESWVGRIGSVGFGRTDRVKVRTIPAFREVRMRYSTTMPSMLLALAVVGCGNSSGPSNSEILAKHEKRTVELAQEKVDKFNSLLPEQHQVEAQDNIKNGNWAEAKRHMEAMPGSPQRAVLFAKIKAGAAEAERLDYGPKPATATMTYALEAAIKPTLHDPESFQGPDLAEPVKESLTLKGKRINCWKVRFSFRARNGFGALRISNGTVWMKNGEAIKESFS